MESDHLVEEMPVRVRAGDDPPPGLFVTFEGVEGCGKSTQILRLARRLEEHGREVVLTREPGGTVIGTRLRAVLLGEFDPPVSPVAEMMLYAADRAQHLTEIIEPALARGAVVLSDRFIDASLAYQGYGRRLGCSLILDLHRHPPLDRRPHRTVLFDLDPAEGLRRARERNDDRGVAHTAGRFEDEELSFHERVRDGYLLLAGQDPARFRVIDAGGTATVVEERVWSAVRDLFV